MDFNKFVKSKKIIKDLSKFTTAPEHKGEKALLYGDDDGGQGYIIMMPNNTYMLELPQEELVSKNLRKLEKKLYDYVAGEYEW